MTLLRSERFDELEIAIHDVTIIAPGQPSQILYVPALAEEPNRAIAEYEKCSARVLAAERLGSRPVDPSTFIVHPPHDVADLSTVSWSGCLFKTGHPDPDSAPALGRALIKAALTDRKGVGCTIGDARERHFSMPSWSNDAVVPLKVPPG